MSAALVITVLRDVRERLADPRHWLKGQWCGYVTPDARRLREVPANVLANCWCLGGAINVAVASMATGPVTATELRSDVERELLETLGLPLAAIYMFNDRASTSHGDVMALLDTTLERLAPAAA